MESKKEVMHTQEPWRLEKAEPERPGNYYVLAPDMNLAIARVYENAGEANARRIVACVNACSRFSTEHLENYPLISEHGFSMYESVKAQRDELLAALKRISAWNEHTVKFAVDHGSNGVRDLYRSIADDAIAKCEVKS